MAPHRQARQRVRITRLLAAIAVVIAGLGISPIEPATATQSQAAAEELPVVWSGQLLNKQGRPTSGNVVAFIRPPAQAFAALPDGPVEGMDSVPLGEATAGKDGRFEIRAVPPTDQIPANYYKADGSLDVMVLAEGSKGDWVIATDTMHFVDEPGVGRAWFTETSRYEQALAEAGAASAGTAEASSRSSLTTAADADQASAVADGERPAALRTQFTGTPISDSAAAAGGGAGDVSAAYVPPAGYVGCSVIASSNPGWRYVTVDQVDAVTYWDMWATYSDAKSTTWDTGVRQEGGSWSFGGTTSWSQSSGEMVVFHAYSGPYNPYRQRRQLGVDHKHLYWRCGGTVQQPGVYYVYTIEPTQVNWNSWVDYSDAIGCLSSSYPYSLAVNSHGSYNRTDNDRASYTLNGSILGFSRGATVSYSTSAEKSWWNDSVYNRYLCGESGPVRESKTRIRAGN